MRQEPTRQTSTRPKRAAVRFVGGGLLTLALAAGCGTSGTGVVLGEPPQPSTSLPSPATTPSAPTSPTPSPGSSDFRTYRDAAYGISLTVPDGYVVATTPGEAADRFPAVLGTSSEAKSKIDDAQSRLRASTVMIAFHAPIDGRSDNVGLIRVTGADLSTPADVQGATFRAQARTSLTNVGATNITFLSTVLDSRPAEQVTYAIARSGETFYGKQYYVAGDHNDVFILTVTAGTPARAEDATKEIADSWTFS